MKHIDLEKILRESREREVRGQVKKRAYDKGSMRPCGNSCGNKIANVNEVGVCWSCRAKKREP